MARLPGIPRILRLRRHDLDQPPQLFTRIAFATPDYCGATSPCYWLRPSFRFPAAVLAAALRHGTHADQSAAVTFYCAIAALMARTWLAIVQHLIGHAHLLEADCPTEFFAGERLRSTLGIALDAAAAGVSFWTPLAGLILACVLPSSTASPAEDGHDTASRSSNVPTKGGHETADLRHPANRPLGRRVATGCCTAGTSRRATQNDAGADRLEHNSRPPIRQLTR
jgi:hypothetical protein